MKISKEDVEHIAHLARLEVDDSLVAPEVNRHSFQAGQIVAKIGDGGILDMPNKMMFQDVSLHIGEEHALVAGRTEQAKVGPRSESDKGNTVGVILQLFIQCPEQRAIIVEEGITH